MQTSTDSGTKAAYVTILVICGAILVSQLLFFLIIYFVKPDIFAQQTSQPLDVVYILALVAVILLVASFVVRRFLLTHAARSKAVALVFVASILGCSLCEAVSLFGLLSAFVAEFQYFYLFFLAGIGGTILHFPSRSALRAAEPEN